MADQIFTAEEFEASNAEGDTVTISEGRLILTLSSGETVTFTPSATGVDINGGASVSNGDLYVTESDLRVLVGDAIIAGLVDAANFQSTSGALILTAPSGVPTDASDPGVVGTILWDSGFLYVCVAANTWKRAAIATW